LEKKTKKIPGVKSPLKRGKKSRWGDTDGDRTALLNNSGATTQKEEEGGSSPFQNFRNQGGYQTHGSGKDINGHPLNRVLIGSSKEEKSEGKKKKISPKAHQPERTSRK